MSTQHYEIKLVKVFEEPETYVRIAYFKNQSGKNNYPPIVIIPGWLSTIELFVPLAQEIAKYTDAYIFEPHGFGPKNDPPTPHKKGFFTIETYVKEFANVFKALEFQDQSFVVLGSCSGASKTFNYLLDGDGPKPLAMAALSPQATYITPFRKVILSSFAIIPSFIMTGVQALILAWLHFYLKFKKPEERKNIEHAAKQFKIVDAWCQRRVVIEFIRKYDIRSRIKELTLPILSFVAKEDFFTSPEKSELFQTQPNFKLIQLETTTHRIQEGNEALIAEKIREFLDELKEK